MQMRWWVLILLTLLVAGGLLFFVRDRILLADAMARAEQVATDFAGSAHRRPAFGTAMPGRAWDHYHAAMATVDPAEAAALLRRGAQSTDTGYPEADLRDGMTMAMPDVLTAIESGRSLLRHADDLAGQGELLGAIRLQVDIAVFGRDLAASGSLVSWCTGCVLMDESFAGIGRTDLRELSRDELWAVSVQLEQLEQLLPRIGLLLELEAAAVAFAVTNDDDLAELPEHWTLLLRILVGSTLTQHQSFLAELRAASDLPWPAAREAAQLAQDQFTDSINPLRRIFAPAAISNYIHMRRQVVARSRAVREVLHYLAFERRLELADPFGNGPLTFTVESDGSLSCASVGPEGHGEVEVLVRR